MKSTFLITITLFLSLFGYSQCNADFTSSNAGNTASFTNTSSGTFIYSWDFGDGNTSSATNPSHNYAVSGTYTVCLTAIYDDSVSFCLDSVCYPVTVFDSTGGSGCVAIADFSSSVSGTFASFTNLSSASSPTYNWSFGDGNSSTSTNPTHNYAANGTYWVCLSVTSFDSITTCFDSTCYSITVFDSTGGSGCIAIADFSTSTSGTSASFTNLSSGSSPTYSWDFGDGNSSTSTNPTHNYASNGSYTVCLFVTANDSITTCYDSTCYTITVQDSTGGSGCIAIADFSTSTSGTSASFTNLSSGPSPSYNWDFGDGNTSTSTNPSHTYASNGTYLVCLYVAATDSLTACYDQMCYSITIQDSTGSGCGATAGFNWSASSTTATFTNTSSGFSPTYSWDFGDGNSSTSMDPSHNYSGPGTYLVCLTITVADSLGTCTDQICNSVVVQDSTSGLEDLSVNNFVLYPNPASTTLSIAFDNAPIGGMLRVSDLTGREMILNELTNKVTTIGVSELPTGVYLIHLFDVDNQLIGLKKFIKQ